MVSGGSSDWMLYAAILTLQPADKMNQKQSVRGHASLRQKKQLQHTASIQRKQHQLI